MRLIILTSIFSIIGFMATGCASSGIYSHSQGDYLQFMQAVDSFTATERRPLGSGDQCAYVDCRDRY